MKWFGWWSHDVSYSLRIYLHRHRSSPRHRPPIPTRMTDPAPNTFGKCKFGPEKFELTQTVRFNRANRAVRRAGFGSKFSFGHTHTSIKRNARVICTPGVRRRRRRRPPRNSLHQRRRRRRRQLPNLLETHTYTRTHTPLAAV